MIIRKISYILVWLMLISALFLPKINLVDLAGSYLRLDDILVFLFSLFFVSTNYSLILQKGLLPRWFFAFIVFNLVSFVSVMINAFIFDRIGIIQGFLFSFRHIEYFIYLYAGFLFAVRGVDLNRFFGFLVWYLTILVALQHFELVGLFGGFSNERASANTAGPFELAVISAFLIFYFVTGNNINSSTIMKIIACSVILIMTQSRITIIATFFVFFGWCFFRIKGRRLINFIPLLIILSLLLISYISYINLNSYELFNRFEKLISMDFEILFNNLVNLPIIKSQSEYFKLAYDDLLLDDSEVDGDASALIRFYRWFLLGLMVFSNAESFIIGVGPSFASVAVDGYYVRLFVETGILGIISYMIFIYYFYKKSKLSNSLYYYVIILIITGLFIDIFVSSKAMFLFWFWFGYSSMRTKERLQKMTELRVLSVKFK